MANDTERRPPHDASAEAPPPAVEGTSDRLIGLAAFIGLLAAVVAGATLWLLLTDPVTVAGVIEESDLSPLIQEFMNLVLTLLAWLLEYL